jgi:uncharacterized protein (DUF305 family)
VTPAKVGSVSPAATDDDQAGVEPDLSATVPDGDPPVGDDEADDGDHGDRPSGPSWAQALVLAVAVGFLGVTLGLFIWGRDTSPGSDSVDVGFLQDMISHHEQALQMATLELANGSDPTVLEFAREVLLFQSMEIGSMDRLLDTYNASRGDPERDAMTWMDMSTPVDQMPGMATEEQMDALRAARGTESDTLFLELMAEHHRGGIHMAQYAAENADTSDVRELAEAYAYNQSIEINEYASLARRLGLPITITEIEVPPAPTR